MKSILELMNQDHKYCDRLFAEAESAVGKADPAAADAAFARFRTTMERHINAEERVLFPALEGKTGERLGPTEVMRREHQMIRDLLDKMAAALAQKQAQQYLGFSETLLVLLQQHNIKEESVLYPMMDQSLADDREALFTQLNATGIA